MKYMGSKARIAKHLLPLILKDRTEGQVYVEPFVGGANMIDKVDGVRVGADSNHFVIEALKMIRDSPNALPKSNKEFTENDYINCRDNKNISKGLTGYAGIAFSFGAKWFGGWSRGKNSKGDQRDYVAEQYRASIKKSPKLKGVSFVACFYNDLCISEDSIIYCDPPYRGATQYKDKFNHDDFWRWCREQVGNGHKVFISEYSAPDDFVCIWEQELKCSVSRTGPHKKATEKLFVHNTQID